MGEEAPGDERGILDRIERLDDPSNYRYLSGEELRGYLDPGPDWTVADLGSGTGFYTAELAPVVGTVYAVDVLDEMHGIYREKGMPANVEPVTADMTNLPFTPGSLDAAVSTRTFHHGVADALDEIKGVLRPGGRFVVVDWSATGAGEREHHRDDEEYFDLATVQSRLLATGFRIGYATERRETFVVVASRRAP